MTSRVLEIQDFSIRELAEKASLVVEGTVRGQRQYLSDDQRWVYTDYELVPSRILFARAAMSRTTPGSSPIIVKKFGGTMQVNGVTVQVLDETVAPLEVRDRVIAFLNESTDKGKFDLLFEMGAFTVKDGRISPLVKSPGILTNVRGMAPTRFAEMVAEEIERRAKAR